MKHLFFFLLMGVASVVLKAQSAKTTNTFNQAQLTDVVLKEQYIQLSTGVKLEYVEKGNTKGAPVIFLHGISDSWHSFEKILPLLPESMHAFSVTHRGHGNSSKPVSGYHPKDFAADIAAFIQQKKLGSAFIVGHSMSGIIAQQFALDYPQLLKGVVIVASDPAIKRNPGMPEFYSEVEKMQTAVERSFMVDFQKATLNKPIDSAYFNLLVDESMKMPVIAFKAAFKGLVDVDYVAELKNIKTPVLILWGDADAFFHSGGQELLKKNISHAKYITYKGTGHAIHWEEPLKFAADITEFVNSIRK
ncbi:alpha/beta fold hydrolase [Lacibacter sediminis]|uniref:Alpha/beta hydrolase n=1 Tax=Lacibacter sediminis TaxID=2760713 RepID=A0A7G5XF85_9BACT|nr:alpha/beta hydrolase [Lacibacter sediminis]QNA44138.1 alpha/beta hydrolase [Lacibacter sediminis]